MIRYKIDVLAELKKAGYTQSRIRQEQVIGQYTLSQIRKRGPITFDTLNLLCELLAMQPGDILEWIPDYEQPTE